VRKKQLIQELKNTVNKLQELADEYEQAKELALTSPKEAIALAEILKAQGNIYAAKLRALKMFKEIEKLDIDIKNNKRKHEKQKAIQLKIEFTDLMEDNNEL